MVKETMHGQETVTKNSESLTDLAFGNSNVCPYSHGFKKQFSTRQSRYLKDKLSSSSFKFHKSAQYLCEHFVAAPHPFHQSQTSGQTHRLSLKERGLTFVVTKYVEAGPAVELEARAGGRPAGQLRLTTLSRRTLHQSFCCFPSSASTAATSRSPHSALLRTTSCLSPQES